MVFVVEVDAREMQELKSMHGADIWAVLHYLFPDRIAQEAA
jgi:hypothetical protein